MTMPATRSKPKLRTIGVGRAAGRGSRRRWRGRRWRSWGRRDWRRLGLPRRPSRPVAYCLVEAGLELDRVVDGEADQDRQDGDRGHRQGAADEAQEAEGEGRGGQGDRQRQQAQAGAEDEEQGQGHHRERDAEEDEEGVLRGRGRGRRRRPGRRRRRSCRPCRAKQGAGAAVFGAGLARGRVVDRGFDQRRAPGGVRTRSGPASAGPRSGPSGCWGRGRRAAPSACPRARARSKTTVATNSSLSMLGALVIP